MNPRPQNAHILSFPASHLHWGCYAVHPVDKRTQIKRGCLHSQKGRRDPQFHFFCTWYCSQDNDTRVVQGKFYTASAGGASVRELHPAAACILQALTRTTEGDARECTFCGCHVAEGQGFSLRAGGVCQTRGVECSQVRFPLCPNFPVRLVLG